MNITRKDIGYTIYSRLEQAIRAWLGEKLLNLFGREWYLHIPIGIMNKFQSEFSIESIKDEIDTPLILLEELNIPDLKEIILYKDSANLFVPNIKTDRKKLEYYFNNLYKIRCKIAHAKRDFCSVDLDLLIDISRYLLKIVNKFGSELTEVLDCIKKNPEKVVIKVPSNFFIYSEKSCYNHITNLPKSDYDTDGGFIGRKDDQRKILEYIAGDIFRVITVSGAGGVGKTALVHKICQNLLNKEELAFDSIIWVSAKEEELTLMGIEDINPTLRNYDDLLNDILITYNFNPNEYNSIKEKEADVDLILRTGENGILLVVDNLETIIDESVIEFIKKIPPPNKVLITSRLGLGEVEKRYALKEMNIKDSIILIRTIAHEKGVHSLAKLPDEVLKKYVVKMSQYPLAIKWVIGQIALGKEINSVVGNLTIPSSDVVKFCFERIFEKNLDDDSKMVLYTLAAYEKPLGRGVLSHISSLSPDILESALRKLIIASFVIPNQQETHEMTIETKYELLSLTRNYIQSKLKSNHKINREINDRIETVQNLIEEADKAGKKYRYSLSAMGAETEEEKIAAKWAFTAYQKYQAGNYDGAIENYKRAAEIAPNFPAIYRNWATMECDAGFYNKAEHYMKKATNLSPNNSILWFVWGNIEKLRQKYDDAVVYFNKALELSPGDAPILGALGEVEKRRGNYELADELLRKALKGSSTKSQIKHKVICDTILADNLRRWAESLYKDRNYQVAINKLEEAFNFAKEAFNLDNEDQRTKNTLLEVSKDYAIQLLYRKNLDEALPFFKEAITEKPNRVKERKVNEVCCYHLMKKYMDIGQNEEAKKYFELGKKSCFHDGKYIKRYKEFSIEFSQERYIGKLFSVQSTRGFGILEVENKSGQTVLLHISDIMPEVSNDEFENLKGKCFSFFISKRKDDKFFAQRAKVIKENQNSPIQ